MNAAIDNRAQPPEPQPDRSPDTPETPPRRGPGRPRRKPADRERAAIIATAQELFARRGPEATTVDEIATLAGVRRQVIYEHFTDKNALFDFVAKVVAEEAQRSFRERLAAKPELDDREWIRYVLLDCYNWCLGSPATLAILRRVHLARHPCLRHARTAIDEHFISLVRTRQAGKCGLSPASAEQLTTLIFGLSSVLVEMPWQDKKPDDVAALLDQFAQMIYVRLNDLRDRRS